MLWHLNSDEHGDEGAAFGTRFSSIFRGKCGVKSQKMAFHGYRHSFKDYCREVETFGGGRMRPRPPSSGKISQMSGGWRYPPRILVEAVQRYAIPGLTLP